MTNAVVMKGAVTEKPAFPGLSTNKSAPQLRLIPVGTPCTAGVARQSVGENENAAARPLHAAPATKGFPTPGTPEWGRFNRRRAELIRGKIRGSLSRAEENELEYLQRETLAAVDRAFPRPPADLMAVEELERRLRSGK